MNSCTKLFNLLDKQHKLYIQTHDYPDYDSVATAYGLQQLFGVRGIASRIVYEGTIHRESLQGLIDEIGITIRHRDEYVIASHDRSVIVDGCKGNRNVSVLVAREIAVIDHHAIDNPENVAYVDIRADYGACATIIYMYYKELGLSIPRDVATALLVGIGMDTAQLTRGVSAADLEAYGTLYPLADTRLVNTVFNNTIQKKDLEFYHNAIERAIIRHRFAFCFFPHECSKNLLGILSDFFMGLRDVDIVVICACNRDEINFSVRSKRESKDASWLIRKTLAGTGSGGGHRHMAGGSIKVPVSFDPQNIYNHFCSLLGIPSLKSSPTGRYTTTSFYQPA